jgi:hypothetical protein
LARAVGDTVREYSILLNLNDLDFRLGFTDLAVDQGRQIISLLRSPGRRPYLRVAQINLVSYLTVRTELSEAREAAEAALALACEEGGFLVRICLQQWALLGALEGRYREAAQLLGFVDAGYARSGDLLEPTERQSYDRLRRLLELAITTHDLAAYRAEGARWCEDRAVAYAVDHLVRRLPDRNPSIDWVPIR